MVRNKAIYLPWRVADGTRDILDCGSRAPRVPSSDEGVQRPEDPRGQ